MVPTAPPSRCRVYQCAEFNPCPTHYVPWERRSSSGRNGSTRRDRELRARTLREEPTCRSCGQRPSTECDHIVPLHRGGARYSRRNTQGLCHDCHHAKTTAESAAAKGSP